MKYDLTYFSSQVDSSLVCPQGHISRRPKGIESLKTLVNSSVQSFTCVTYTVYCLMFYLGRIFFTIRINYTKGESQIKPTVDIFWSLERNIQKSANRNHWQSLFSCIVLNPLPQDPRWKLWQECWSTTERRKGQIHGH